jgi:drug/metabolite transporter (DMT)-like permease
VSTVALALSAALCYAVSDFLAQRVTRGGASVVSTLTWVLATGTAITVPIAIVAGDSPHGRAELIDVGYAATGGAVYLVAYASLVRGLRVGNISLVTPLASLQGAVAAVIAIALFAERITALTAAGLALAVAGSTMAAIAPGFRAGQGLDPRVGSTEPGGRGSVVRLRAASGAGWGLLCALAFGIVITLYGAITSISPLTAVAVSRVTSFALILPLATRFGMHVPHGLRGTALLSGALEASGFLLLVVAIAVGPVAVASVVVAQFATFAVLLGLIANRERPSRVQLVGVLCTILAVTALALA